MTSEQIEKFFEKNDDEHGKFEKILFKYSTRSDIHAFITLNIMFPDDGHIIECAEHDKIWLSPEDEQIQKLGEAELLILIRCGISYEYGMGFFINV